MSGYSYIAPQRGWWEAARTAAFGAILDAYSAVGTPIDHPPRIYIINNFTDKPVYISFDGATDHLAIPPGGHLIVDSTTNGIAIPKETTFYVKRFTAGDAPTSGSVVVSIGYKV